MEMTRDDLLILLSEISQVNVNEGCSISYMGLNNERKLEQLRHRIHDDWGTLIGIWELKNAKTAKQLMDIILKYEPKNTTSSQWKNDKEDCLISSKSLGDLERKLHTLQQNIDSLTSKLANSGSHIGELEGNFFGHVSSEKIREQLTHLNTEMSSSLTDTAALIRSMNENQQLSTRMIKGLLLLQMKVYDLINSSVEAGKKADEDILDLSKKLNLTDTDLNELIHFMYRKEVDQRKHFRDIELFVQGELSEARIGIQENREACENISKRVSEVLEQIQYLRQNEEKQEREWSNQFEKQNLRISELYKLQDKIVQCQSGLANRIVTKGQVKDICVFVLKKVLEDANFSKRNEFLVQGDSLSKEDIGKRIEELFQEYIVKDEPDETVALSGKSKSSLLWKIAIVGTGILCLANLMVTLLS
ncbi:MAG: hypothetical protein V8R28_25415 [Bacteroides cellulosilyticus]|jgi:hypothetical protein